jgi:ferredoxin
MIVAKRKPFGEIKASLEGYRNILVAGCGTCVAVCLAGGKKEVGLLASQLRMSFGLDKKEIRVDEVTLERQCDREFLEGIKEEAQKAGAILSLACGAGVQFMAEAYPRIPVYPGVDTTFIGVTEGAGLWTERCGACGACLLGATGGLCPRTLCPKGLENGPCGGMVEGNCEVDPERPCVWVQIYERLSREGRIKEMEGIRPPLDFRRRTRPGKITHSAYFRRYHAGDQ